MVEPLELHGVSKRYGTRSPWVLRGVDLRLPPGSLTRVDGANGSGKSTLLSLIAGIGRPSRGRVVGGGRRAYVPERLPSVLPFDVAGYLARLGAVHGLDERTARRRAADWLERLGASAWLRTPMTALSKGTAQKVAITQALMADADLLVLDEAWSGLDATSRAVVDETVGERVATGVAVVFVDHQRAARSGSADVYRVERGCVVRAPDPDPALLARPTDVVEIEYLDGDVPRTFRVQAQSSDAALRELLGDPGCHVRSVHTIGAVDLDGPSWPLAHR
ncbi:MAG TPA: ATP-binding cassette domain-containing protein [Kineosporiaceae bacterium]